MIGTSCNCRGVRTDSTYRELIVSFFDCIYPDSGFFSMQSQKNSRRVVDFAIRNGKSLRGNHLCGAIDFQSKLDVIEQTIENFPEIRDWDCCHELIRNDGQFRRGIGLDKTNEAFCRAKDKDSSLNLFYCDYAFTETKWTAIYELIKTLKLLGSPIDGFSAQIYSNIRPSIFGSSPMTLDWKINLKWLKSIKDLGLKIHCPEIVVWQPPRLPNLAELRVVSRKSSLVKETLKSLLSFLIAVEEVQFNAYETILSDLLVDVKPDLIGFWSAFDSYPWNWEGNRCKAGFWDEDYNLKDSGKVLIDLLAS